MVLPEYFTSILKLCYIQNLFRLNNMFIQNIKLIFIDILARMWKNGFKFIIGNIIIIWSNVKFAKMLYSYDNLVYGIKEDGYERDVGMLLIWQESSMKLRSKSEMLVDILVILRLLVSKAEYFESF